MQNKDFSLAFIVIRMYGLSEIFMAIMNSTYLVESYLKYSRLSFHENWLIVRILMDLTWALFLLQRTDLILKLLQKGIEKCGLKEPEAENPVK